MTSYAQPPTSYTGPGFAEAMVEDTLPTCRMQPCRR